MIRRNIELEARLIDDLLDLSRIVRGRLRLELEVVDIHKLIRRAMEICRDETLVAGLHVLTELKAQHHHVRADHAADHASRLEPDSQRRQVHASRRPAHDPHDQPVHQPAAAARRSRTGTASRSSLKTPASALIPRSCRGCSTRSSRARTTCGADPEGSGWGWRSAGRLPRPWAAGSRRRAPDADRARRSAWN